MNQSEKRKKQIQSNILQLTKEIPSHINLISVSKRFPIDDIQSAYEVGLRDFGENRVDELLEKSQKAIELGLNDIRWHFIGNLQSNKINKLVRCQNLEIIHSIDRIEILEKLDNSIKVSHRPLKYFVQIKTSTEDEKYGFADIGDIERAVNFVSTKLSFHGFMTMSEIRTNDFESSARTCFEQLERMKREWEEKTDKRIYISMGMSADYKIAMDYSTNYIRLGTLIFGDRE